MIAADAPVELFDEIDSTLLEARRRAEAGDLAPVWLIARRQSAGRGRRGRAWVSGEGNLLATYLGPVDAAPADVALMGFACGLAIAEATDALVGAGRATLKWPNDVLIDAAKAAGILIDSGVAADGRRWWALGFGVNLAVAPEGLDQATTSIAAISQSAPPAPLDFLELVRARLAVWAVSLERAGFEPMRAAWLARAHGLGASARARVGDAVIEGRILGLSPRGELELETANGLTRLAAGDLELSQSSAV